MVADSERPTIDVTLRVNGQAHGLTVEPRETLAEVLRARLALTGTKVSCDSQVCGTCTVLVDGIPISSCTMLAADAEERDVVTVEGLADPDTGRLCDLQEAFIEHAAFQCGFCTPGFLMTATALLREHPNATRHEIVEGLEGNICRCTGYEAIIEAVLDVAEGSAS